MLTLATPTPRCPYYVLPGSEINGVTQPLFAKLQAQQRKCIEEAGRLKDLAFVAEGLGWVWGLRVPLRKSRGKGAGAWA